MSSDGHQRDSPPTRWRSSPRQDNQGPQPTSKASRVGGIQIKGIAHERDDDPRRIQRGAPDIQETRASRDSYNYQDDFDDDQPVRRRRSPSYNGRRPHSRSRSRSRSPSHGQRSDRRRYTDRDREGYKSPPRREYHNRSPSPRKRERSPRYGGPPSRELILEGLALNITEENISQELKQYYKVSHLEDVRVIRERKTGESRGFGFIRFPTVNDASVFLEQNYPTIYLYGSDSESQSAKVRIAFSRERSERDRSGSEKDWVCPNCAIVNFSRRSDCFKCGHSKIGMSTNPLIPAKPANFSNCGDSDVSPDNIPSQYLIFRSLEPSVTEEILFKGAAKLLRANEAGGEDNGKHLAPKMASTSTVAHAGAKPNSILRSLLVRDRVTEESWGFGFVEFEGVEDAQAAVAKYNALEKFTIASKPVMVDYIHAGVFVPLINAPSTNKSTKSAQRFAISASTNPALQLIYWDESAYVKELAAPTTAKDNHRNDKSSKKELGNKDGNTESMLKAKKRKADSAAENTNAPKKPMASHLQFWTDRHAELHSEAAKAQPDTVEDGISGAGPEALQQQSYADPQKHCCYLCARQFKTAAEVNRHERLSELHQSNLRNEEAVAKGLARLRKFDIPILASSGSAPSSKGAADLSEYRDRARERRTAFNQPKQPSSSTETKSPSDAGAAAPLATADTPSDEPSQSKGSAMLSKMGWNSSTGQGLGATGSGMTAPITTDLYVAGVGLGAEGGKVGDAVAEASRATRGDYKDRVRERTRERFEKAA